MYYYWICENCGREWFIEVNEVQDQKFIYCSECGEEKAVADIERDSDYHMAV